MTNLLIRLFIKNSGEIQNPEVRERYGVLGGTVGICCNIVLCLAKLLAGILSSSIAIIADAFNNLSDAGSSVVTLAGFKLAGKPPDKEHPFGHGRIEYIAGLVVAIIIILVGVELGKSSIDKILHPEAMDFSLLALAILVISIAVKLWMFLFNRKMGLLIDSPTMTATARDSFNDVIATAAVIVSMLIGHFTAYNIDGYAGLLVALFILYTGFTTARDTLNPLLGQMPSKEFTDSIESKVTSYEGICGIHDLIVHNYGPGRCLVSLHAEVPCDGDILTIHDTIDNIERDLKESMHCEVVIHMDPIVTKDATVTTTKQQVSAVIAAIDPLLKMHDFRMVAGPTHTNLIFDVVVPYKYHLTDQEICAQITAAVQEINPDFLLVINFDKVYAG